MINGVYPILRKALFTLDPERAHVFALRSLSVLHRCGLSRVLANPVSAPCKVMGLNFPNPIGLAAGVDNNADYLEALGALGFGFIEVGGITPLPQSGNPKPRLFRLTEHEAIINRKGFPNKGVEYLAKRLEKTRYRGILGINIAKNRDTSLDNAVEDYLFCFRALWKYASYITVNVSSPNTVGLRQLQQEDYLREILRALKQEQRLISRTQLKYVPLVVKLSPDSTSDELYSQANVLLAQQVDGVIATNTTLSRRGVEVARHANETGGLSGRPLRAQSTQVIKQLNSVFQNKIPIIASGGLVDAASAKEKFAAGAKLAQVYTGFIYQGSNIINIIKT